MFKLDLRGEWSLAKAKAPDDAIAALVPGDVHSALLAAGGIPDPYRGTNELGVQWVGRETWLYTREFQAPDDLLAAPRVFLNCDSIDTIAKIFLNGELAGETDNMFLRVRIEVRRLLKAGRNTLKIVIASAESEAHDRAAKLAYPLPYIVFPQQSHHRNLVRKVQCQAAWDWGPCLMSAGIPGDIYLQTERVGRLEHVYTTQTHAAGLCEVEVFAEILSAAGGEETLKATLDTVSAIKTVTLVPGLNVVAVKLELGSPALWWPNGLGPQPLHPLTVETCGTQVVKQLGLRRLEVLSEKDDTGRSLLIRVNGEDVFCKGANWIPCDALPQRQTPEALRDLLESAAKANMNCLRVWGGGQYESEAFYSLCDQLGLLVWQDFAFACALYPVEPRFLSSVRAEAEYQIKRLRDHACIALWCGNNEATGMLPKQDGRDRYLVDYDRLYEGVLGAMVDQCDPQRQFRPSSPCIARDDYSSTNQNPNAGDVHNFDVWSGYNIEDFWQLRARFCSEYGYQSLPSLDTIRTFAEEEDFNLSSPVLEHHQRAWRGYGFMSQMMSRYFLMPKDFENFVHLSQVLQAVAVKTGSEHWRRLRPLCMGALYWQLNDTWPVASWSSLEYGGKWKPLHHVARRFFANVMVTAERDGDGGFTVYAVNDELRDVAGKLALLFVNLTGETVKRLDLDVQLPRASAAQLLRLAPAESPFKPEEGFVRIELSTTAGDVFNEFFLAPWKRMHLPQVNVELAVSERAGGAFQVDVTVDKPAFFFNLDVPGIKGEFNTNLFTLLPGRRWPFVFSPRRETPVQAFKQALTYWHLRASHR